MSTPAPLFIFFHKIFLFFPYDILSPFWNRKKELLTFPFFSNNNQSTHNNASCDPKKRKHLFFNQEVTYLTGIPIASVQQQNYAKSTEPGSNIKNIYNFIDLFFRMKKELAIHTTIPRKNKKVEVYIYIWFDVRNMVIYSLFHFVD